jgi:CDP-diacylglycerol---glycerol-3-phosphate 3-phosphatidyltransferase
MNLTLADKVTISRLLLLPVAVVLYLLGSDLGYYLSALMVVIIAIGDFLDGMIARRMDQETNFGAFLDPVADKICVVTALLLSVFHFANVEVTVCALIMILREIAISALREFMAQRGMRNKVNVLYASKCKTLAQGIAILFLILSSVSHSPRFLYLFGLFLLVIATILSVWTLAVYLNSSRKELFT